ncbi:hypothetical protein niasHS_003869 [Heterodera schachtii]|uniref:Very-long-chain (3R)-3-hydroxyacyl-CoA dehydratase n=1 Tax=Heterodera schachtii TaxID=97005 RepID=A0ABD2K3F6_HETSC
MDTQQNLRPFVYWAQDLEHIYLKVDVKEAKDIDIRILEDGRLVDFSAFAYSPNTANNCIKYTFRLPLFDSVNESPELTRVGGIRVEFTLAKIKPTFWGNGILASDEQKQTYRWLKFDFEKWRDDPNDEQSADESGDGSAELTRNAHIERLMRELNLEKDQLMFSEGQLRQHVNMLFSCYLFLFNLAMFFFTFFILCSILFDFVSTEKADFLLDFWPANFKWLLIATLFQSLDLFHSLVGLTNAGSVASLLQISGRLAMLFIVNGCPPLWHWSPVFSLVLTYLLSEQFRYPFYALKTLGISLRFVTWLRYNVWLLLYPLGLFLEAFVLLISVPFYYSSGVYSLQLPNALNFSYNFGVVLALFSFICFPFIGFTLIKHMFKQRRTKMDELYREEAAMKRSRQKKHQ